MNITQKKPVLFRSLFFATILSIFAIGAVLAQGSVVRGTVTSADGEPIPGASVLIKGTGLGVAADIDGKYTIEVPSNATLVVSFIGMLTKEI
jgi:hypothetical protein